jgi:hypothetical protein
MMFILEIHPLLNVKKPNEKGQKKSSRPKQPKSSKPEKSKSKSRIDDVSTTSLVTMMIERGKPKHQPIDDCSVSPSHWHLG